MKQEIKQTAEESALKAYPVCLVYKENMAGGDEEDVNESNRFAYEEGFMAGAELMRKDYEIRKVTGELSDGYHTFNELYRYRMLYNAAFFNMLPKSIVHKSKRHSDGEECFGGGWFIVMGNLPTGQISNHYRLEYWDLFHVPERETADEWDGHTPEMAAQRLHEYLLNPKPAIEMNALIDYKTGDIVGLDKDRLRDFANENKASAVTLRISER